MSGGRFYYTRGALASASRARLGGFRREACLSNVAPLTVDRCAGEPAPAPTLQALPALHTELGGLAIRRLLPRSQRRLVGPWCFCDLFGPVAFDAGKPMDVPPHPHTGLQTVSWLLEGAVLHNDSLGQRAVARPGALNLMTAGRGIAHAEETPPGASGRLHGVQLWVALPDADRQTEPSFEHHASPTIVELPGGRATVIVGELAGVRSPARTFSPMVGAELGVAAGRELVAPLDPGFEHALILFDGHVDLEGQRLEADTLYYLGTGRRELRLSSGNGRSRLLLLGGAPFGETVLMWWNFVARRSDEMAAAREDWQAGRRFGEVRAYGGPRLEAPPFRARLVPPGAAGD